MVHLVAGLKNNFLIMLEKVTFCTCSNDAHSNFLDKVTTLIQKRIKKKK